MIVDSPKNTRGNIMVAAQILQTTVSKFACMIQNDEIAYVPLSWSAVKPAESSE